MELDEGSQFSKKNKVYSGCGHGHSNWPGNALVTF